MMTRIHFVIFCSFSMMVAISLWLMWMPLPRQAPARANTLFGSEVNASTSPAVFSCWTSLDPKYRHKDGTYTICVSSDGNSGTPFYCGQVMIAGRN